MLLLVLGGPFCGGLLFGGLLLLGAVLDPPQPAAESSRSSAKRAARMIPPRGKRKSSPIRIWRSLRSFPMNGIRDDFLAARGTEQLVDLSCGHGATKDEALRKGAAHLLQKPCLVVGLDTFGDRLEAE